MQPNIIYIIPAREGSKGLPHKNRKLIDYTGSQLIDVADKVYITTDDDTLKKYAEKVGFNVINRPASLAADDTSVKDVLMHAVSEIKPSGDTLLVVLYPTYPQRKKCNIDDAIEFFLLNNAKSLLCQKKYEGVSPYLMMFKLDGYHGGQVINHNLYRRQDYPTMFEISHFIVIMRVDELPKLNLNLYNSQTLFMPISDVVDVDTQEDLKKFFTD